MGALVLYSQCDSSFCGVVMSVMSVIQTAEYSMSKILSVGEKLLTISMLWKSNVDFVDTSFCWLWQSVARDHSVHQAYFFHQFHFEILHSSVGLANKFLVGMTIDYMLSVSWQHTSVAKCVGFLIALHNCCTSLANQC
jgi:hypothetical protein